MSVFTIDRSALDEELIAQAPAMFQAMQSLANARLTLEEAKNTEAVVYAETADYMRESANTKPTEKAIENACVKHPAVTQARQDVIEARHAFDVAQAAVTALEHKKKALGDLVTLHGQAYFAAPRVKGDARPAMEEARKRKARTKARRDRAASQEKANGQEARPKKKPARQGEDETTRARTKTKRKRTREEA